MKRFTAECAVVTAALLAVSCGGDAAEAGAGSGPVATQDAPAASDGPWRSDWFPDIANGADDDAFLASAQPQNLPLWVYDRAEREGHTAVLRPALRLNPFYQSADFDGDGRLDVAVLVSNADGQLGILLVHGGERGSVLFGAGHDFGNGGDDFGWLTNWRVMPGGAGGTGTDALEVLKLESAGGLIEWTGTRYQWRQRGD